MTCAHIAKPKRPYQGVAAFVPVRSMARGNTALASNLSLGWDEESIHPGEGSA